MHLTDEQNRERIELLKQKQIKAHNAAAVLKEVIFRQLNEGKALGGLAFQYDDAVTRYKLYTEELYESTT